MNNVIANLTREHRRLVIYDELCPVYAKYDKKEEARALFADAGFSDVRLHHRHGYYVDRQRDEEMMRERRAMMSDCLACGRPGVFWNKKANRDVWCYTTPHVVVWVPDGLVIIKGGATIYEGDTPIFHQAGNEQDYLDETNIISCREKVEWIAERVASRKKLLDARANFGHFLSDAKESYDVVGIELSTAAVKWSRDHFGVNNNAIALRASV